MTFATHEELFVHTCSQIKVEIDEVDTEKQFESVVQEDFKNEIDPSCVSEMDYSPKKKISRKSKTQKKEGKKQKNGEEAAVSEDTKKKRRIKKEKLEAEFKLEPTDFVNLEHFDMGDNSNLELSEEFISLILQQVDDLCENIKHGDPDIQRTLEVNKNLNDAVSCYRSKVDLESDSIIDPLHEKDCASNELNSDLGEESFDCDTKDSDYFSKIETTNPLYRLLLLKQESICTDHD